MKIVTKAYQSNEEKHIFTEGINYFSIPNKSIWGMGDRDTLKILSKIKLNGKWLNLAAGDGRYNSYLLKNAESVTTNDIDESALSKLWFTTPEEYKNRLKTKVFDITHKFPFSNKTFDGIFCTGTLHLFSEPILKKIFHEIKRVLKNNGTIIIDFATDVKRKLPDGSLKIKKNEIGYHMDQAINLITKLLNGYRIKKYIGSVPKELIKVGKIEYIFSCKYILVIAKRM